MGCQEVPVNLTGLRPWATCQSSPPALGCRPRQPDRSWAGLAARTAFTLIEVMIASGIFFMATFAILALVAGTLRNARALQRGDVDAGMAAAQIYQLLKTNRDAFVSGSGDFGESYPGYSFEFASTEAQTNGLLQVEILVNRRGAQKPVDHLTIWVYSPDAKSGPGQSVFR
jgi:hypothetical protein